MPNKKTIYQCNYCGKEYTNYDECDECEKSHTHNTEKSVEKIELLTMKQAAEKCHLPYRILLAAARQGSLVTIKSGKRFYTTTKHLNNFLDKPQEIVF